MYSKVLASLPYANKGKEIYVFWRGHFHTDTPDHVLRSFARVKL